MSETNPKRLETLFAAALELSAAERARYLEDACGTDPAARAEVQSLLDAYSQAGSFLQDPVSPESMDLQGGTSPPSLRPGTMLGTFRIDAELGAGGMATVYSARDTRLDRKVAVKVLAPHSEPGADSRHRFEREALAISHLSHPHICTLYDFGRATVPEVSGEVDYLVMEHMDGRTLADRLERGPLPVDLAVRYAIEIADALECAHREGIVHRDLKPQNIMVTKSGTKLLDFGLATFAAGSAWIGSAPSVLTRPGIMVGTVQYMAPEQVKGLDADARADLFSLGLVLFEMVAGRRAFSRPSAVETLNAILHEEPAPLPESVPGGLKTIIAHCLEKDRNQRFQTSRDVAFALETFALLPTPGRQRQEHPERRWFGAALAVTTLMAVAVLAARSLPSVTDDLGDYTVVPFAVDASVERSAAWSPDGKSVAYVRTDAKGEAQLVVRGSESDVTTALTSGVSGNTRPFWARDSSRIFFGEGPIKSVSVTGGDVKTEFPDAIAADVSPDGKTFALWRPVNMSGRTSASLWTGPREGPFVRYDPAPFAIDANNVPNVVRFSPDGSTILLWVAAAPSGIWLAPYPAAAGRLPIRMFQQVAGGVAGADWLPDSRHIVLSANGMLWLADTRVGTIRRVLSGSTVAEGPAVAPNGDRLLFDDVRTSSAVVELSLAGGPPRVLTGGTRHEGSGTWSKLGDRLAYVSDRRGPDEIWTRSAEELSERLLLKPEDFPDPAPDHIFSLRYSPDGERLSFATAAKTRDGEFRSQLWVMPAKGGTPRPLTGEREGVVRASWAPEGRSLVVRLRRDGLMGIWEIGLDPETPYRRIVLPPEVHVWHTECSPSGAWIAGVGYRQVGVVATIVFARDGSHIRELPNLGSPALLWSRDERTIYGVATENGRSVLRALDLASGRVTTKAQFGDPLNLGEPINDTLQFIPTSDGRSFVTTSVENHGDIWMLKDLRVPRTDWLRWPWR